MKFEKTNNEKKIGIKEWFGCIIRIRSQNTYSGMAINRRNYLELYIVSSSMDT